MKINIYGVLIVIFFASNVFLQAQVPSADTLEAASRTAPADTAARRRDSLGFAPVVSHGRISAFDSSIKSIRPADYQFSNYVQASDLVADATFFFPLSLASYGSFNHFSVYGALPNSTAVTLNGRPATNLEFNSFHIDNYSPEAFSEIQIYTGSDAAILGGAPGALINFTERQHNSAVPFTRIWYSQSAYDFTGADAIFTQNFAPKWNINLGFRNLSSDGRFENSSTENWNVRAALRYSPDSLTTYSLSEEFVSRREDLWGGVEPATSTDFFDALSATPRFPTLDEKQTRHDLTLTLTHKNTASSILSGNLFFTHNELLRNSGDGFFFNEADSNSIDISRSYYAGASGRYEARVGEFFSYMAGGEGYYSSLPATTLWEGFSGISAAGFARLTFNLGANLSLAGGARIDYKYDKVAIALGGKINLMGEDDARTYADLSIAERLPSPAEGTALSKESSLLALVGWRSAKDKFSAELFFRNVQNPIIAESVPDTFLMKFSNSAESASYAGVNFGASYSIGRIFVKARLSGGAAIEGSKVINRYPYVYGDITTYYEYKIGRSALRGGIKAAFYGGFNPYRLHPLYQAYERTNLDPGIEGNGFDAFLGAALGNAFVKVSFENLLSRGYYFVAAYPQFDRVLRLSVAWSFFD